jgi:hypothetical protein
VENSEAGTALKIQRFLFQTFINQKAKALSGFWEKTKKIILSDWIIVYPILS